MMKKSPHEKFLHIYVCTSFFCIFIFVYLIKMTIYLNMQKNTAQIRVHKRRPIAITHSSQRKQRRFLGHLVLRIFKLLLAIMRHYVLQFLINLGVLNLLFLMQC